MLSIQMLEICFVILNVDENKSQQNVCVGKLLDIWCHHQAIIQYDCLMMTLYVEKLPNINFLLWFIFIYDSNALSVLLVSLPADSWLEILYDSNTFSVLLVSLLVDSWLGILHYCYSPDKQKQKQLAHF